MAMTEVSQATLALTQSLDGYFLPQALESLKQIAGAAWWVEWAAITYMIDTIIFRPISSE